MKGDRFARIVEKALKHREGSYSNDVISKLLRKEHAAVRRMVKKKPQEYRLTDGTIPPILSMFAADILAALDRRKMKGG